MNCESRWRKEAREVIDAALTEARSAGLTGDALVAYVDARYPFGPRANHPYKIWLNERALQVFGIKKPMSGSKAKPKPESDAPTLFD